MRGFKKIGLMVGFAVVITQLGGVRAPAQDRTSIEFRNRFVAAKNQYSDYSKLIEPKLTPGAVMVADAGVAQPLLSARDEAFLYTQARRIVDSARLGSGQSSGKWHNTTPYTLHVPGGNMGYPAFWIRDAVMMLGGDFIPAGELEGWIRLISSTIPGPKDWHLRPGVVVPAYAVPDHINLNGKPTFYPGSYETGSKQGGSRFGKYPPLDDYFYFVIAVYRHWKMTGSTALFQSKLRTSFNEMKLADLCEKIYQAVPADPPSGLVIAGDVKNENAKDFGFCDVEYKSGKLLFPSTLKFIAASELAQMFRATGETAKAKRYLEDASRLKQSIPATFFHAGRRRSEGWLHSATGVGNQPDVWGSAFALWSGAVDGPRARRVARALVRAFRERTAVREGCVRQILTTDPVNHGGWQLSGVPVGTYQNGGYWGTPVGWYLTALSKVDRRAAADMAHDYIRFLRDHLRPDGMTEAWEWFNPDTGQKANPLYVATVALPYLSLKEAGLISVKKPALALQ